MTNENVYLSRMADAVKDKLFFIEHLPANVGVFVDYGCADGALIAELANIYPNADFIGYDTNENFIARAEERGITNAVFTSNWEQVKYSIGCSFGPRVLILSSVLHEVYTYEGACGIHDFWQRVKQFKYDYICVRDMGVCWSDSNRKTSREALNQVYKWANCSEQQKSRLRDFESKRGSITNSLNLCEFLLKYSYVENWDREVNENYLALSVGDIIFLMEEMGYSPIYFQHWVLPYIANKIYTDFGISMPYNTHYKGVWKR